ncbi:MAG: DUF2225 domain-containing protein [Bacillota bacterium]|nr:DUF2225 domain-containing protein [Bacillota bacterium]
MAKLNPIYNSSLTCPVCDRKIEVTKVRSRFVKLSGQDEDFCPYYETYNPILYEPWVCKYCGYAAHSTVFTEVNFNDRKQVLENIKPKWTSRDFTGERDIDKALETFKIVLYNLQVRGAPLSEFGKICLRIAWMYRYKGEWVDEYKYLKYSYEYYKNSYSQEYLSNKKLDEYTLMYILGELARRLELFDEAMQWFGKLISASANPKEKSKIQPRLIEMTKDQIHITREKMKKKDIAINE